MKDDGKFGPVTVLLIRLAGNKNETLLVCSSDITFQSKLHVHNKSCNFQALRSVTADSRRTAR